MSACLPITGIFGSFTLESVKLEANLSVLKRTISGKHTNGVLWDREWPHMDWQHQRCTHSRRHLSSDLAQIVW